MSTSNGKCLVCGHKVDDFHKGWEQDPYFYRCKMCGPIKLTEMAVDRIQMQDFRTWSEQVTKESGLIHPELVEFHEKNLMEKQLLLPRLKMNLP